MPWKCLSFVMPGHGRSKGRRALHAYVPGSHVVSDGTSKTWLAGTSPAVTD
jgi:hypothetical protein